MTGATREGIVLDGTYCYPEGGGQPAYFAAADLAAIERRALLDLIPDHVGPLRVVETGDVDLCPRGGTHVDSLGEVGRIGIASCTSKGSVTDRIEFELVEE